MSDLSLVSSCQEQGVKFHKTSRTGVRNVSWGSIPYYSPYPDKCNISYTPCPELSMFFQSITQHLMVTYG